MSVAQRWQYIPSSTIAQTDQQDAAQHWGDLQRQALAQVWADNQRAQSASLINQYSSPAAGNETPPGYGDQVPPAMPMPGSRTLSDAGLTPDETAGLDVSTPPEAPQNPSEGTVPQAGVPSSVAHPEDPLSPLRPTFDFGALAGYGTSDVAPTVPLGGQTVTSPLVNTGEGTPLGDVINKAWQAYSEGGLPQGWQGTGHGLPADLAVGGAGALGAAGMAFPPIAAIGEAPQLVGAAGKAIKEAPGLERGLRQAFYGPEQATSTAIQKIGKMLFGKQPDVTPAIQESTFSRVLTAANKALFDDRAGLAKLQEIAARDAGRPLGPDEVPAQLSLFNPNGMSQVRSEEVIRPALQAVGNDRQWLSTYLTAMDNIDVATAMGAKAEAAGMAKEIGPVAGESAVSRANSALQQYERQLSLADPNDLVLQKSIQAKIDRVRGIYERAQAKVDLNTQAAEAARNAVASEAGTSTRLNRAFSGGLDITLSQRAIQDMPAEIGSERLQAIEQSAGQFWRLAAQNRRILVNSGVITPEAAAEWAADYPHYSKTVILDHLAAPENIPAGQKFSLSSTGIKENTLEGTVRNREDPISSMYRQVYQTDAIALRNRTFQALINLRGLSPEVAAAIRPVPDAYVPVKNEQKVMGFVKGERQTYVMPEDLAKLVDITPRSAIPGLSQAMGVVRAVLASRNPAFAPIHAAITIVPYLERTMTREGGPQSLPRVAVALARGYAEAFKGITSGTHTGDFADLLRQGGGMFGLMRPDIATAAPSLNDLARERFWTINDRSDLARIAGDFVSGKWVENFINRVDYGPRIAAYRLARERGTHPVFAATEGRNVTIDFSQGGSVAKVLNQFIPFFNVALQASAQPFRTIQDNPRAAMATFLTTLVAPVAAAEAWNRSDPQRSQDYDDVPQYLKNAGVVVMLPGEAPVDAQGNRQPQKITIMLREFSPLAVLTREIMGRVLGAPGTPWQELLPGILQGISPVPLESGSSLVGRFLPGGPLLETPVGLATNTNLFTNRQIVSKRADERAAPLAQLAAGAVGARPSQAEFAIRGLGAGIGQMALSASQIGQQPRDSGVSGTPVVGPAIGRFVTGRGGQLLTNAEDNRLTPDGRKVLRDAGLLDISPVGSSIRAVPLTNDERLEYQELANAYVDQAIQKASSTPAYARLSQGQQQAELQKAMAAARERAAAKVYASISSAERRARIASGTGG